MVKWKRFSLLISLMCFSGLAAPAENYKKGFHVDGGFYQNHLKQYFNTPTGYENLLGSFSGYLRIRRTMPMGRKWGFEPSIGTRVPWKSGLDGTTRKFNTHVDLTFSYPLAPWIRFRLGPGIQWLLSMGDGGEVVLNNGTSTSTFYTPMYVSHSFIVTAQGGISFLVGSRFSLNLEVYGTGLLDGLRRNFDALATLGWRI